jgi:predicted O-methyltransferase YrrM
VPLVDLGDVERRDFRGVLSPAPEVGAKREGVDEVFLDNAEEYYKKYQAFDYWRMLIKQAIEKLEIKDVKTIVEFGCGFGNSTFPLLDLFPNARVVATDISPNLLAILRRLIDARELSARCLPVAMDAQKDYINDGYADLVLGSALLHHLAEPEPFIARAMQIMKPGGVAIFFEPFEAGHAILRLICPTISEEAERRRESGRAIDWLRTIPVSLEPQIMRGSLPGWRDRNDKWAFPRSVLEQIATRAGSELIVYPLHDNNRQFTRHFAYMLEAYGGMNRSDVPKWAWAVFDRFDRRIFSPEMLLDVPLEGCVIFRKPTSSSRYETWKAASQIYGRWVASSHVQGAIDEAPRHPLGRVTAYPDTWINFDDLARPVPFRKTFNYPGAYIDANHQGLAEAVTGRHGIPGLIDIGIDGYLLHGDALKLYEMAYFADGDVLELGTHKGLSTSILAQALEARGNGIVETVDIDCQANMLARETLRGRPGADRITFTISDATRRLDELIAVGRAFGFVFIDHWHGYEATRDAAVRMHSLLRPGGFVLFHDFLDPGNADPAHVYGVFQAVLDTLAADTRFTFYSNAGCSGLFRRTV